VDNPLEQKPSADSIQRVREFARDLAYGVAIGIWNPPIRTTILGRTKEWSAEIEPEHFDGDIDPFSKYVEEKWEDGPPSEYLMRSFGYLELYYDSEQGDRAYLLTEKAFSLLDVPTSPPSVFISYKRDQSSALALLVEARLKIAGNPNPFIDKNLVPGDEWHGRLEETIRRCQYFVCLVGRETLKSPYVRREIEWAANAPNCKIISVWHGCTMDEVEDSPEVLRNRHAIQVMGESALAYENAISQMLNGIGYSTY
jgi:hypothetical protein